MYFPIKHYGSKLISVSFRIIYGMLYNISRQKSYPHSINFYSDFLRSMAVKHLLHSAGFYLPILESRLKERSVPRTFFSHRLTQNKKTQVSYKQMEVRRKKFMGTQQFNFLNPTGFRCGCTPSQQVRKYANGEKKQINGTNSMIYHNKTHWHYHFKHVISSNLAVSYKFLIGMTK